MMLYNEKPKSKYNRRQNVVLPLIGLRGKIIKRKGIIIDLYYNEKEQNYRYIVKCSPNVYTSFWKYYEKRESQIEKN